jgi:hypothetical protein
MDKEISNATWRFGVLFGVFFSTLLFLSQLIFSHTSISL